MNIWLEFLVALAVVLILTPYVRKLAGATGVLDVPSQRKVHLQPTPLLGGVAIYAAILIAWVVSSCFLPALRAHPLPLIFLVATLLMLVGVCDDCINLFWFHKLAIQLAVAGVLYQCGVRVQLAWLPEWCNLALTLFWLVGITNAINFLDNMNGLAAGLCAIAAGCFVAMGLIYDALPVLGVAAAVAGACIGFLRFNYRQASIFMGDAGSLVLGLLLAVTGLLLRFPGRANWVTWMAPVMVMLVPVFDMTLVCLSRLSQGRNPLATPGKDHLSHRLVSLGFSRVQAVDTIYGLALLCGGAGLLITRLPAWGAYIVGGLLLLLFVSGQILLALRTPVQYPPRDPPPS